MATYHPQAAPVQVIAAPKHSSDTTVTWALVAVVCVLVAAAAGYGVAQTTGTTWNDVERVTQLAQREGAVAGRTKGFTRGVQAGKREGRIAGRYQGAQGASDAFNQGWNNGFDLGYQREHARRGDDVATFGLTSLDAGYDDASMMFDEPLYSDASLGATSPYTSSYYGSPYTAGSAAYGSYYGR